MSSGSLPPGLAPKPGIHYPGPAPHSGIAPSAFVSQASSGLVTANNIPLHHFAGGGAGKLNNALPHAVIPPKVSPSSMPLKSVTNHHPLLGGMSQHQSGHLQHQQHARTGHPAVRPSTTTTTTLEAKTNHLHAGLFHPAPLPAQPTLLVLGAKPSPPKPILKIELVPLDHLPRNRGVMLSWDVVDADKGVFAKIVKYQLFAYQETHQPPTSGLWRKVGDDVAAMPLPMACTLSHFLNGHRYHFAVRAIDEHSRVGAFSDPQSVYLDA